MVGARTWMLWMNVCKQSFVDSKHIFCPKFPKFLKIPKPPTTACSYAQAARVCASAVAKSSRVICKNRPLGL